MSDTEVARLLQEIETDQNTLVTNTDTLTTRVRIQVQDPESGDFGFASADPFIFASRIIVYEHAKVHDGNAFSVSNRFTSIAAGNTVEILLQNPAGNFSHLRNYKFISTVAPGDVVLYEGPTFTDAGTGLTEHNLRRSSSNTAGLTVTHSPTVTDNGTELEADLISGERRAGGAATETVEEWLLNTGTDYLLEYTNNSNATADFVTFNAFWYEA